MEYKVKNIYNKLQELYPQAGCSLRFDTPFQLLIATILSSQCTDEKVNKITDNLFNAADTPEKFLEFSREDLIEYIKSAGLYHHKSKNILTTCQILVDEHGGEVPKSREQLEQLPGVGRKTANVVLSNAFDVPALAVDTHVLRVANRLGISKGKTPLDVEEELMEKLPEKLWGVFHHLLIFHGRNICKARRPACYNCELYENCENYPLI